MRCHKRTRPTMIACTCPAQTAHIRIPLCTRTEAERWRRAAPSDCGDFITSQSMKNIQEARARKEKERDRATRPPPHLLQGHDDGCGIVAWQVADAQRQREAG